MSQLITVPAFIFEQGECPDSDPPITVLYYLKGDDTSTIEFRQGDQCMYFDDIRTLTKLLALVKKYEDQAIRILKDR